MFVLTDNDGSVEALRRFGTINIETLEQFMVAALVFFGSVVAFIFFLKRLLAWMDERGWITYTGHVPTYRSVGNAFLELQHLAEPQKEYVLELKEEEEQKRDEDDEAGPDDPTRGIARHASDEKEETHRRCISGAASLTAKYLGRLDAQDPADRLSRSGNGDHGDDRGTEADGRERPGRDTILLRREDEGQRHGDG